MKFLFMFAQWKPPLYMNKHEAKCSLLLLLRDTCYYFVDYINCKYLFFENFRLCSSAEVEIVLKV